MKIRKKPVVVDAWIIDTYELQYQGNVLDWVWDEYQKNHGRIDIGRDPLGEMVLSVRTLEGTMTAKNGDVLVKGVDGELYAIKWEIFLKTYEILDEDTTDGFIDLTPEGGTDSERSIVVDSIEDMPDGSAIVRVDMDYESLKTFAKLGLLQSLKEAAEKIVRDHGDS